jgi:hypothetical protein
MNPHIIITGQARHGKDTIGSFLVNECGYVRAGFAHALRAEVIASYEASPDVVDEAFLTHVDCKEKPDLRLALIHCADNAFIYAALDAFADEDGDMTLGSRLSCARSPRRIMQAWGTEYRRMQRPDYWIARVQSIVGVSDSPVVICDGRTPNEIAWARECGFERIHVQRPAMRHAIAAHVTENIEPPDESTHVLVNEEGELESLGAAVIGLVERLSGQSEIRSSRELAGAY